MKDRALAIAAGWYDVGPEKRRATRFAIRLGWRKPHARAGEGASIEEVRQDAALCPEEYFICKACDGGPWHVSWGGICPNCSGAD